MFEVFPILFLTAKSNIGFFSSHQQTFENVNISSMEKKEDKLWQNILNQSM
jgi:beta-xylosidase